MKKTFILSVSLLFSILMYSQNSEQDCESARQKYLQQNPDVARAGMNAWTHYTTFGKNEGRKWPKCDNSEENKELYNEIDNNIYNSASVEVKPNYPGGLDNFYNFFLKNFQVQNEEELKGNVFVTFVVEKDGSLSDIKVLRDIGYGTGKEAVRILKSCPRWNPGEQNGKKVRVLYSLPITIDSNSLVTVSNSTTDISKTIVEPEPSIDGISNCEINGKLFFSNAIKYVGQCKNNSANGWGTLELMNGDKLSGFFMDNKLQDNFLNYYVAKTNKTIFGPNINSAFNGPCISVNNNNYSVRDENYENGAYRGNSDLFEVSTPEFTLNENFCQAWGFFAKIKSIRIPNTNKIIFNSEREYNNNGDKKIWITIVNLETNKIVFNFGSFENPISTLTNEKPGEPNFIGFSKNNDYAYYNIKRSIYDKDSFLSLNLNNGIKKIVTQLPYELTNKNKFFFTKENIDEINIQNLTEIGSKVLKDSSYIKVYNFKKEKALIENSENGIQSFGSLIIRIGKDNNIILKKLIDNITVADFDINENIKKIALSYKGIDSTYLSYFDSDSFSKISDVFVKSNTDFEMLRDVKFSKSGAYLIYGSSIFSGTELFFGFTGGLYGFNKNENCILTNSTGTLKAYSLEQKRLLWQYNIGDNFWNTGFFNVDNDFVIISGRMDYSSQGKPINGMKFYKFKMPEAIFVRSDFKIKPDDFEKTDEIETNKPIVESKQILAKNKSKKNDVDDDNWLMKAFIWGFNEAEKNPKPYSYTPTASSNSSSTKKSNLCYACNRKIKFRIWSGGQHNSGRCYGGWKDEENTKPGFVKCTGCIGYGVNWDYDGSCPVSKPCNYNCSGGSGGWVKCSICYGKGVN